MLPLRLSGMDLNFPATFDSQFAGACHHIGAGERAVMSLNSPSMTILMLGKYPKTPFKWLLGPRLLKAAKC